MNIPANTCATCRFCQPYGAAAESKEPPSADDSDDLTKVRSRANSMPFGECRRRPPVVYFYAQENAWVTGYPSVHEDGWCALWDPAHGVSLLMQHPPLSAKAH